MSPKDHAVEFILPIDPRYGIASIARRIWHAAATDHSIADKFARIQTLMGSGKPLICEEHYNLYLRLKNDIPHLDIPTAPEWIRPAFAAAYLRAKARVASGQVRGLLDNLEGRLGMVVELVGKLEPSFVGELLAETLLAAHKDDGFARMLVTAADEFRSLATELYGPDGTDRPKALAMMVGGGGPGAGNCQCCRDGQCAPCSCWIIVVIIIVIIVTK